MSISLDHMIVPAANRVAAARQLAGLLGVPWAEQAAIGPFSAVYVSPSLTLDFDEWPEPIPRQHYCFRVGEAEFDAILARLHAAGRPYPGVQATIRDADGNELPAGMSGEVYLKSPAQMLEYFGDPTATANTIVDGWIRTGDVGYLDEDGFLVIRDRVKDLIIKGGRNYYPHEIEAAAGARPRWAYILGAGLGAAGLEAVVIGRRQGFRPAVAFGGREGGQRLGTLGKCGFGSYVYFLFLLYVCGMFAFAVEEGAFGGNETLPELFVLFAECMTNGFPLVSETVERIGGCLPF